MLDEAGAFQKMIVAKGVAEVMPNPLKGDVFIDVTIEWHRFQAALNLEPYMALHSVDGVRAVGSCSLGVASISNAFENRLREDPCIQWAVCKYERQARIDLGGLKDAGMRRLALEFGLPILGVKTGIVFGHPAFFYASNGYEALVRLASSHPRKIHNYPANNYLGHWALSAVLDCGLRPSADHEQWIGQMRRVCAA